MGREKIKRFHNLIQFSRSISHFSTFFIAMFSWLGTWNIATFEETIPMSTYLLAFTVSDFKNITENTEELEFSVYASSKDYGNMQFALNVGIEAMKALEEYTGIPYPLNKMDFIAIDDFLYGAMVSALFLASAQVQ